MKMKLVRVEAVAFYQSFDEDGDPLGPEIPLKTKVGEGEQTTFLPLVWHGKAIDAMVTELRGHADALAENIKKAEAEKKQ